jgi:hypothetical protein
VQSLARANGIITVQVTGREPMASDASGWSVAAAALADRIASPVHLTGTILISDATVTIRFLPHSGRILTRDLTRLRELAQSWRSRADVSFVLTVSAASHPEVTRRRITLLKHELDDKVSNMLRPDSNLEPEQVEVSVVQAIDVAAERSHIQN